MAKQVFALTWTIENYSPHLHRFGECVYSPKFQMKGVNADEWHFYISVIPPLSDESQFSVILVNNCENPKNGEMDNCVVAIENFQGRQILKQATQNLQNGVKEQCVFQNSFNKIEGILHAWAENLFTVRFIINSSTSGENVDEKLKTINCADKFSFPWELDAPQFNEWTNGREFKLSKTVLLQINLSLHEDSLAIKIQREDKREEKKNQLVSCKFSLLDINGILENGQFKMDTFYFGEDPKDVWVFPLLCLRESMMNQRSKYVNGNNTFTLMCDICVTNGLSMEQSSKGTFYVNLPEEQSDDEDLSVPEYLRHLD